MTVDEAVTRSGFKNPADIGSRRYAQKSLWPNETLLFAYNCNFSIVPSNTKLVPNKPYHLKNKVCGVLAVTDRRVFVCHNVMGKSIFKEIPLQQVQSIDDAINKYAVSLFLSGQLRIKGLTEIFLADLNLKQCKYIPDFKSAVYYTPDRGEAFQSNTGSVNAADELLKFKSLLDAGLISKEEFDVQKNKLLL